MRSDCIKISTEEETKMQLQSKVVKSFAQSNRERMDWSLKIPAFEKEKCSMGL
jgi:hypothetical protein